MAPTLGSAKASLVTSLQELDLRSDTIELVAQVHSALDKAEEAGRSFEPPAPPTQPLARPIPAHDGGGAAHGGGGIYSQSALESAVEMDARSDTIVLVSEARGALDAAGAALQVLQGRVSAHASAGAARAST